MIDVLLDLQLITASCLTLTIYACPIKVYGITIQETLCSYMTFSTAMSRTKKNRLLGIIKSHSWHAYLVRLSVESMRSDWLCRTPHKRHEVSEKPIQNWTQV